MSVLLELLLGLVAALAPRAGGEDLSVRLAELGSPAAEDRARAQRWLAVHVGPEHAGEIERAASGADAEVRRRLALAVGAEDRSLVLAAELARSADPDAAGVGRAAIGEIVARFCPRLDRRSLRGDELDLALRARARRRGVAVLQADLGAPLDETLDLLRRSGEAPLGLVIDPAVASRAERRAASEEVLFLGTWDRLLLALAGAHGLALEGFGLDADGDAEGGAFVVFGAAPGTARALLADWAAQAGSAPALCALIATGWPAAQGLAEARARAGDEGAREALVRTASLGRWPSIWDARADVERLCARLAAAAGSGEPGDAAAAERLARALAAAPAVLGDGASTPEILLRAFDAGEGDARRHLLVALEGIGAAGAAAPGWEERLRALLAAPPDGADAALLRQALRAWVAALAPRGVAPPSIGAPGRLLGPLSGWSAAEFRELGALLVASGAKPPADLGDPARLDALGLTASLPEARTAVWTWLAGTGDVEGAARVCLATTERPEVFGELLAHAARRGDGLAARETLARARALAGDAEARRAVDVVALHAGLIEDEPRAALLREVPELGRRDLALLGALAGTPGEEGEPAREALLARLGEVLAQDPAPELVLSCTDAVERALAALLLARADQDAERLRGRAAERVRRAPAGGTRSRLVAFAWPPLPPALAPLDLRLLRRP